MREIKFRAWDSHQKVMFYLFRMCKPAGSGTLAFECKDIYHSEWENTLWDDLSIMQYTGLKDKNGKEIYEGDICLKHWSKETYGDRTPEVGVIKWVDFGGRYTHESNGLYGHKYYCELYENLTNPEYPRSLFEVIGNIYENPELLKQ